VAVLVNLETTPVQLHAKPFASGDPTGRGNSSYLAVTHLVHGVPTARAVLAAFTDLHAIYTTSWLVLDRLNPVQRLILAHLDIPLPWPETKGITTTFADRRLDHPLCGKLGLTPFGGHRVRWLVPSE
jgi:hypothetical protein